MNLSKELGFITLVEEIFWKTPYIQNFENRLNIGRIVALVKRNRSAKYFT